LGYLFIHKDGLAVVEFNDGVKFSFKTGLTSSDVKPGGKLGDNWHDYDTGAWVVPTMISYGRVPVKLRFELEDLWMALRDYPALEYTSKKEDDFGDPVSTGDVTYVDLFGNVEHIVDNAKRVLVNKTRPDHTLHEGYVARHVWKSGDKFYIQSLGFGTGALATMNELPSGLVWGAISMRTIRSLAVRYYEKRTGKDGSLFPGEPGYSEIPKVAQ
jgi:hypothetical protein